jgi:hypothetical protein
LVVVRAERPVARADDAVLRADDFVRAALLLAALRLRVAAAFFAAACLWVLV